MSKLIRTIKRYPNFFATVFCAAIIVLSLNLAYAYHHQHQNIITPVATSDTPDPQDPPQNSKELPVQKLKPLNSTSSSAPSYNQAPATDNTNKCNQIQSEAESDLSSLNKQDLQQLAIMKQIMAAQNFGVSHPGISTMVSQSELVQQFNAAQKKANQLSSKLGSDRSNYVNELIGLNCTQQANTILNYKP